MNGIRYPEKYGVIATPLLAAMLIVLLASCGRQGPLVPTTTSATPLEQALTRWRQGDRAGAIQRFLDADWTGGPVFSSGSVLSNRESELPGLSQPELTRLMDKVGVQLTIIVPSFSFVRFGRAHTLSIAISDLGADDESIDFSLLPGPSAILVPESLPAGYFFSCQWVPIKQGYSPSASFSI